MKKDKNASPVQCRFCKTFHEMDSEREACEEQHRAIKSIKKSHYKEYDTYPNSIDVRFSDDVVIRFKR